MKDLPIDKDKIMSCFGDFEIQGVFSKKDNKPKEYVITFTMLDKKEAKLNVYEKDGGKVTLFEKVGKNQDVSLKIAEHIIAKCTYTTSTDSPISISNIPQETFDILLGLLQYEGHVCISINPIPFGNKYTIEGRLKDKAYLSYYSTSLLLIQGPGLLLKSDIMLILADYLPYKDVIQTQLTLIESIAKPDDVIESLRKHLPKSFDFLGDTLVTIMTPSMTVYEAKSSVKDYTYLAFSVLRGMEGVIKKLFLQVGIEVKKGLGVYFAEHRSKFSLLPEYNNIFKNSSKRVAIDELFNFFHYNRNRLFHVDSTIETSKTIETLEEAIDLINTTLSLIEKNYLLFTNV